MEKDREQKAPRQPHLIRTREDVPREEVPREDVPKEHATKKSTGTDEGGEGGTAGNWGGGATSRTEEEGPSEKGKRSATGT